MANSIYSLMRQMGAIHYSAAFLEQSSDAKHLCRRALLDGKEAVAVEAAALDYELNQDLEFRLKALIK